MVFETWYTQTNADLCIFYERSKGKAVVVTLLVDNTIFVGDAKEEVSAIRLLQQGNETPRNHAIVSYQNSSYIGLHYACRLWNGVRACVRHLNVEPTPLKLRKCGRFYGNTSLLAIIYYIHTVRFVSNERTTTVPPSPKGGQLQVIEPTSAPYLNDHGRYKSNKMTSNIC